MLDLTREILRSEAARFAEHQSTYPEPSLYGVTDGKAVGTYIEHKFRAHLEAEYAFEAGNSASGIDFPGLNVDLKVTSARQPQSSCPFKSPRQKIFGLGYSLLVFVYDKSDDAVTHTATLSIGSAVFVDAERTGDYQMTAGLLQLLANGATEEEIVAFMSDKMLPVDDIQAFSLAAEVIASPPKQGYLTISNALQWRLQYGRVLTAAGAVSGIHRLR